MKQIILMTAAVASISACGVEPSAEVTMLQDACQAGDLNACATVEKMRVDQHQASATELQKASTALQDAGSIKPHTVVYGG
jgi:hypothetical protein